MVNLEPEWFLKGQKLLSYLISIYNAKEKKINTFSNIKNILSTSLNTSMKLNL